MKINKQIFILIFFGTISFLHPIFGMEEEQNNVYSLDQEEGDEPLDINKLMELMEWSSASQKEIGILECDSCNKLFKSSTQSKNTCPECIETEKQLSQNINAIVFPKI